MRSRCRDQQVHDSLQLRVALLTAIAVAVTVVIIGGAAYATTRYALTRQLDATLNGIAAQAAGKPGTRADVDAFSTISQNLSGGTTFAVVTNEGVLRPPAEITITPGAPELDVAAGRQDRALRTLDASNGEPYRVATLPLRRPGTALMVARPLANQRAILKLVAGATLGLGVGGVALAGLVGAAVARSGLRPIRELTRAVEAVRRTETPTPVLVQGRHELSRLATEFNAMVAALEEARVQQAALIADAGHELRTPLTSLRTNIELFDLDQRTGLLDQRARQEMLIDVKEQLAEFAALITDLVRLSRVEAGQTVMPVDLAAVLHSAVRRVRRRGAGLVFDVAVEPFFVVGEPGPLERACTNLLDNAVKFSPPGGTVTVSLTTEITTEPPGGTTAGLSRPGEAARIRVADQGPGIPEEDQPLIFDRAYRSASTRDKPGTGLGLSIVAQAVARHGGWVRVGRAPEGGAEFVLNLPGSSTVDGLEWSGTEVSRPAAVAG